MPIIVTPSPDNFDQNVDVAVGLGFPLAIAGTASGSGQFSQTFTINEQVVHNMRQVLLTIKGEIPNNPNFGSNLYRLIFDPATQELNEAIRVEINTTLEAFMPYVTVDSIDINADEDNNTMNVRINFTVDATGFQQALAVTYSGTTGTATATAATTTGGY